MPATSQKQQEFFSVKSTTLFSIGAKLQQCWQGEKTKVERAKFSHRCGFAEFRRAAVKLESSTRHFKRRINTNTHSSYQSLKMQAHQRVNIPKSRLDWYFRCTFSLTLFGTAGWILALSLKEATWIPNLFTNPNSIYKLYLQHWGPALGKLKLGRENPIRASKRTVQESGWFSNFLGHWLWP